MPDSSLNATKDSDPAPFYASLHEQGEVVWDDSMQAWLVAGFSACKEVLRHDVTRLRHGDVDRIETVAGIAGSARGLKFLVGKEQRQLHQWWMREFNPAKMAEYQTTLVEPMVNYAIDLVIESGRAELVNDIAARIPARAIAAVLGMPWDDDAWMDRVKALLDRVAVYFNLRFMHDDRVITDATAAGDELNEVMKPYVDEASSGKAQGILADLWRDGLEMIPGWSDVDMMAHIRTTFLAGTDTTNLGISNALYLILTDAGLAAKLVDGGTDVIARFVEETLRTHGPVHFRERKANEDFDIAGVHIRKDQSVVPLLAAADRDPARFSCPGQIDLKRPAPRDHLAFNFGPRVCVGAGLARAEMTETVKAVLRRMENLRPDPDAPQPRFAGFVLRSWGPLHVTFTPGERLSHLGQ